MKRKTNSYLHIITLPFAVSAAFEFLPAWLYWPIALIGGMTWLGACAMLIQKEE